MSTLDNYACRSLPIDTGAELGPALPASAKIAAISMLYNDSHAGNLAFDPYSVTVPGNNKVNPRGVSLQSMNASLIGNMSFTTTPPPVSVGSVPYTFNYAMARPAHAHTEAAPDRHDQLSARMERSPPGLASLICANIPGR